VPCAVRIARSPRAVRSGAPRHAARAAAALAFPGQSSVLLCHADAAGGRTEMMRLFVHAGDWIARRMQGPNPNSANLSGCPQARGWQSVRASAARSPSRRKMDHGSGRQGRAPRGDAAFTRRRPASRIARTLRAVRMARHRYSAGSAARAYLSAPIFCYFVPSASAPLGSGGQRCSRSGAPARLRLSQR
jgi:hypothetical protein